MDRHERIRTPKDSPIQRVYEKPEAADGEHILVDRLWPRGFSREKARLSEWRKDLAPSGELRRWFRHDADRWEGFLKRYRAELEEAGKAEVLRRTSGRSEGAPQRGT